MRLLFTIFFYFTTLFIANGQENLFAVAKNGKWGLVNKTGRFILDYKYDYLEYFKEQNKFIYDYKGKKGLINDRGEILSEPIYEHIVLIDSTWVKSKQNGKWNLFTSTKTHFEYAYDSIVCIAPSIFLLYEKNKAEIYHGAVKKKSETSFLKARIFNKKIVAAFNSNASYTLFNTTNLDLLIADIDTVMPIAFNYAIVNKKDYSYLIDLKKEVLIGVEMQQVMYTYGDLFQCKIKGGNFLFKASESAYYNIPKLDNILSFDYPFLYYRKNAKRGIWNLEKNEEVLLPNFELATQIKEGFLVGDFNRFGVLDSDQKEIIPLIYESIDVYDNVYVVKLNGVYSALSKKGEKLTKSEYTKIKVYDRSIKCYYSNSITLIKLNDNGSFKSEKKYDDYMSISIEKESLPRRKSINMNFGTPGTNENEESNVQDYGWFQPVYMRNFKDTVVEFRSQLWGLKDTADSVIIRAKYKDIAIDKDSDLTKAYFGRRLKTNFSFSTESLKKNWLFRLSETTCANYQPPFQLINTKSCTYLTKTKFLAVNIADFENCYYARAVVNKPVLIDPSGELAKENLTFYGNYSENILRICEGGEIELTPFIKKSTISSVKDFFINTGSRNEKISPIEKYISINNGKWYYLNKAGKQLNDIPFEKAEEFLHNRAIVSMKGKWGVVDTAMNIIIPFEYENINRIVVDDKSFFEVGKKVKKNYLYNKTSGDLTSTEIKTLNYFYQGTWFAQKKDSKNWALVDTNLNTLTAYEYDLVYPFKNGYATVVKKGKKTIIDPLGNEMLPFFKVKKIESIGFDRFALTNTKGVMVITILGDTLLKDTECKKILESTADYLVYENRGKQILLLNFMSTAELPKKSRLLSYDLNENIFFIQKNGKKRLYSLSEERYISKDLLNIQSIGEGAMIYRGDNGLLGYLNFNGDTLCQPLFKKLGNIKNGWAFAREKKERGIINIKGDYLFEERVFRVRQAGDNHTFITKSGIGLISAHGNLLVPPLYLKIELYNSVFYKAIKKNNTCDIYTLEGVRVNDKPYQDIKGITPLGIIVKHEKFDYLYSGYLNKSLSFQNIRPVSSRLFLLDENKHKGLYDADGVLIIPIQYHKIEVVRGHFQVSFFNSFGYYDFMGKALADPYY